MKRKYEDKIQDWIDTSDKALLIYGARQVGKTYLIREMLNRNNISYFEVNFQEREDILNSISKLCTAEEISMKLALYSDIPVVEGKSVIFWKNPGSGSMTRAFLEGMTREAPQDVQLIHVIDRHIEYCTGCFACKRNGGTCRHSDDMSALLAEMLESDLLLFSFPLYCYGFPAPLKALLDRTMPLSSMTMRKSGERYEHVAQADFSHLRY